MSYLTLPQTKLRKPTRTLSGVTPITVVPEPRPCNNICLYCPWLEVPMSYTPKSPAIMRANQLNYDPYQQVKARLKAFEVMQHPTQKIELIVIGGTFLEYPKDYIINFVKSCYDALNGFISSNLEEAIKSNETAARRCVAFCIETRPDVCSLEDIKLMRELGVTRVELGVQILDDEVYRKVRRGHTVQDVKEAFKTLKDAGFKVGAHIMPGLYGSNEENDIEKFKLLFTEDFRPDQLKIYPTLVLEGSGLKDLYQKGLYKPYTDSQILEVLERMLKLVPEYCRVMRIMREIPEDYIVAGSIKTHHRNILEKNLKNLNEIRSREVGLVSRYKKIDPNVKLKVIEYNSSSGKEFFLSYVNNDNILFALSRLRITETPLLHNCNAIIREIHVYGKEAQFKEKSFQHIGLGKSLMLEMENIAKQYTNKIAVIAGVGVRAYFEKLGYKLEGTYIVKELSNLLCCMTKNF